MVKRKEKNMNRFINVLIVLAAVSFVVGIGVGYGLILPVFPAGTFWKFSIGCLGFTITLILLQIRDKQ
jgi:uncharacterized membrane protein YczE